jgi:hypothetical protein
MGIVRMGVPTELVTALRRQASSDTFVETGTYRGETAIWAAKTFTRVVTIEQAQSFYDAAKVRLAPLKNVEVRFGNSRTELSRLAESLSGPVVFWLDAHWSGGETYGQGDECPLLDELAVIAKRPNADIILIDDARLFLEPPPVPHLPEQWPSIAEVCAALGAPERRFIVIFEDVIVAVPLALKTPLQVFCQAHSVPKSPMGTAWQDSLTAARSLKKLVTQYVR